MQHITQINLFSDFQYESSALRFVCVSRKEKRLSRREGGGPHFPDFPFNIINVNI